MKVMEIYCCIILKLGSERDRGNEREKREGGKKEGRGRGEVVNARVREDTRVQLEKR